MGESGRGTPSSWSRRFRVLRSIKNIAARMSPTPAVAPTTAPAMTPALFELPPLFIPCSSMASEGITVLIRMMVVRIRVFLNPTIFLSLT